MGVTSLMEVISNPIACSARMADSRPEPGPLTRISTSFMPCDIAWRAASCATCCAAYAVLLREPLKPTRPALDQPSRLPCMSVMVTWVLLNVARMLATPDVMFFDPLALMIFLAAASSANNSAAVGATGVAAAAAGAAGGAAFPASAVSAAPGDFFGALAALGSAAALGASAAGAVSGLVSFFAAGFLGLVSSAIKQNPISGCRSWHSDCAARRRSCGGLCACGRWFVCAGRAPANRGDDGCPGNT